MVLLAVLTILLILVLVAVLVVDLIRISGALEGIGGGSRGYMGENMGHTLSLLSKARWGVRAIETQTAVIEPQVTKLNTGLRAIDAGLASVEENLGGIVTALERQGTRR
jgi:hypothetical protein